MSQRAPQELHLHPRVGQQALPEEKVQRAVDEAVARLQPFRPQPVHSLVAVFDWDHRLPSKTFMLRLHLSYDAASRERFAQSLAQRRNEIAERDRYPEFDVPDFSGLPADEAYDVELSGELAIESMRLVSPWRREVAEIDGALAVATVRGSSQFADVKRGVPDRSPALGELEAVAWTPPCESGQNRWTLDVWWLTAFDGRMGRGWSFLVDVGARSVVASREFSVRA
jgi:hypothetical protein